MRTHLRNENKKDFPVPYQLPEREIHNQYIRGLDIVNLDDYMCAYMCASHQIIPVSSINNWKILNRKEHTLLFNQLSSDHSPCYRTDLRVIGRETEKAKRAESLGNCINYCKDNPLCDSVNW